ncbi:MAG: GNAT family N-acetyltransferase [Oleiphilaceae bacterium]|nr:GNAT family N-acetyltransferase [Oleiphilaceae bacterium]
MEIRDANVGDVEAIAEIHAESWLQTYSKVLTKEYLEQKAPEERRAVWSNRLSSRDENQKVIVSESQGQIIGFACGYYGTSKISEAYLDNLHVKKEFRSRGVGQQLLKSIAEWISIKDHKAGLCLLVNQDNENAQEFYRRLGAENHSSSVWNAPDGSIVPTYWFTWRSAADLASPV